MTALVRDSDGSAQSIRTAYLVGCDGGSSAVRRHLGIELAGEGNLLELRQALYRCVELVDQLPIGNGPGRGRRFYPALGNKDCRIAFIYSGRSKYL